MALELSSFVENETALLEKRAREFKDFIALELPRQHVDRVAALRKTGLLEIIPGNEDGLALEIQEGITAFNGEHYALPSVEAIAEYWKKHQEIFALKMEQGFTRLHIVPFGYPLNYILEKTKAVILDHGEHGTLLAADGTPIDCDTEDPLSIIKEILEGVDESGDLVYETTKFDEANHGGKTKQEILDDTTRAFPGFHVLLLQKSLVIPREGEGVEIGGRKQLEANKTPNECVALMQEDPSYAYETGLTVEDELIFMVTHLTETNKMINDFQDDVTLYNHLTNCYLKSSNAIPSLFWARWRRQMDMSRNGPTNGTNEWGCRTAVGEIKPKS